eukprot:GHVU01147224.1.p2 GENE.GHVU01147224.1~~GHVU01147224.1.p2  ORF type:complete len:105 (+),score=4.16 GHVU01147224.1:677-991(+)
MNGRTKHYFDSGSNDKFLPAAFSREIKSTDKINYRLKLFLPSALVPFYHLLVRCERQSSFGYYVGLAVLRYFVITDGKGILVLVTAASPRPKPRLHPLQKELLQ